MYLCIKYDDNCCYHSAGVCRQCFHYAFGRLGPVALYLGHKIKNIFVAQRDQFRCST